MTYDQWKAKCDEWLQDDDRPEDDGEEAFKLIAMAVRSLEFDVDELSDLIESIAPDDADRLAIAHMRLGNLVNHLFKQRAA